MTTSTIWWILLAAMVIVALGTYLTVALGDTEGQALLSDDALREAIHGASGGSVLMAVAGVIGVAGEWRTGQANQTFMSTPRRERVLAAKAAVYTGVGLIFGVVASLVALPIAWAVYRAEGVTFPLDNAVVWTSLGGVIAPAVRRDWSLHVYHRADRQRPCRRIYRKGGRTVLLCVHHCNRSNRQRLCARYVLWSVRSLIVAGLPEPAR
jgi:hypothetical protein